MVVAAQCDLRHATRLFLAEHAARGDLRAAEILKVLAGEGAEMALDGPYGRCRVAIAVCTAKRPGMLRHCLESIASQIVSAQVEVEAVVVDNEGEPNNQTLVLAAAARCRFPVHYVHEPRQGIPQARNAALEKCRELDADWIAFTDDDCWASPTWLARHLDAAARYNADVVYGRREFVFPGPRPYWGLRPEQSAWAEGQRLLYASTHNVLFSTRLLGRGHAALPFDERLTHGEDTDFFHRMALRGARIVYSAEPLVLEAVAADRATLQYQTRRAYYYAASRSSFNRRYKGIAQATLKLASRCFLQAPVAAARLAAAPLVWPFSDDLFRELVSKGMARLAGAVGGAAGLLGLDGNPYRSIDGY